MRRSLLLAALLAPAALLPVGAQAELCRFAGTTSRDGRLELQTETAERDGVVTVDARVRFGIRVWGTDYRYLGQEISAWRGGALEWIALNQRYFADAEPTRQQWDVYRREGDRLAASRMQAKRRADFARLFPHFLPHWPEARFGASWLADFNGAERRPDLDLPADGVRTPLALALFWSRFLPPGGTSLVVALPSFKRDKLAPIDIRPATAADGALRWTAPLRYPALAPSSFATVRATADGYLLDETLEVGTRWISGRAEIHALGCTGVQIRPLAAPPVAPAPAASAAGRTAPTPPRSGS